MLFEITGLSQYGNFYFKLDSEELSLYFEREQEILLYDGSKYEIIDIS